MTRVPLALAACVLAGLPAGAGAAGWLAGAGSPSVALASSARSAVAQPRHDGFGWPLPPPHRVTRRFAAPETRYGPGHRGVDLAGRPGEQVLAAAAGTVVFAGSVVDRPVVSIDHPDGLRTTYEPVTPAVHAGQAVRRGQVIGTLLAGHPGCTAAACLHWGVRRARHDYLDPLGLLDLAPVRLLPVRVGRG
jgi:murein DD-endopeptidase MepM/ murein hydrolase activator NlpD